MSIRDSDRYTEKGRMSERKIESGQVREKEGACDSSCNLLGSSD